MTDENDKNVPRKCDNRQIVRNIFGAFMVIVYVGMGILLLLNFFQWEEPRFNWVRYLGSAMFIAYGFWRAYRQVKGIDSNI